MAKMDLLAAFQVLSAIIISIVKVCAALKYAAVAFLRRFAAKAWDGNIHKQMLKAA